MNDRFQVHRVHKMYHLAICLEKSCTLTLLHFYNLQVIFQAMKAALSVRVLKKILAHAVHFQVICVLGMNQEQ